jgi:hypothetical protein
MRVNFYSSERVLSRSTQVPRLLNCGKRPRVAGSTYPLWHSGFQGPPCLPPLVDQVPVFWAEHWKAEFIIDLVQVAVKPGLMNWVRGITEQAPTGLLQLRVFRLCSDEDRNIRSASFQSVRKS